MLGPNLDLSNCKSSHCNHWFIELSIWAAAWPSLYVLISIFIDFTHILSFKMKHAVWSVLISFYPRLTLNRWHNRYAWPLKTFMITFNQFSVIYIYICIYNLFIYSTPFSTNDLKKIGTKGIQSHLIKIPKLISVEQQQKIWSSKIIMKETRWILDFYLEETTTKT